MSYGKKETKVGLNGTFFVHHVNMGNSDYFKEKRVAIQTGLSINNTTRLIAINESELNVEDSKFNFDGQFQPGDTAHIDVKVKAKKANIQTILSILPGSTYNKLKAYRSDGDFYFNGAIKGDISSTIRPAIDFNFGFNNTSIYHPKTKQKLTKAKLKGVFSNGKSHAAYTSSLKISEAGGLLDNKPFKFKLLYKNFKDPYVDFDFNGNFSFPALLRILPQHTIKNPKGQLVLNMSLKGKINDLTNRYKSNNVKANGSIQIKDVSLYETSSKLSYQGINGEFQLQNRDLLIKNFTGTAGNSDVQFDGKFHHFLSFVLFNYQPVKLEANFRSSYLDLDELLRSRDTSGQSSSSNEYSFHISPKLNFDFSCYVDRINFDRATKGHEYKKLRGKVSLKSQVLKYKNISFELANGKVILKNGKIDARERENVTVSTQAELKHIAVDSLFYLFHDFHNPLLTYKNLDGFLSGGIKASLVYNSKLQLKHELIDIDNNVSLDKGALNDFKPLMDLYDYMVTYEDKKMMRLLGVKMYKFFKTDNPNINNFQHLSFSALKTNDINVRQNTIDITKIFLESNAGNIEIWGNQNYKTNELDYRIAVQIKNYHKINKAKANDELYGQVGQDKSDGIWLYYQMVGTLDNYEFKIDWDRMLKQKKTKLMNDLKLNSVKPIEYVVPSEEDEEYFEDDF